MELLVIDNVEAWEKLEKDWDRLLETSIKPYPFLEYWYLRNWWDHLGIGEWQKDQSQLYVIAGFEGGVLKAAAPLFLSSKEGHPRALRFIGQIEATDYLDFIASQNDLPTFIGQLLVYLAANPELGGLDLANLQNDSPSLLLLKELSQQKKMTYQARVLQPAPSIFLPASWEEFLQSLSKKQRHEVRRKQRNIERDYKTELVFVEDDQQIDPAMQTFIGMMRNEDAKAAFLTPEAEAFLAGLGRKAHEHRRLKLAFLTLDGEKTAAYLNFVYENRLWVYNTGWNTEFAKVSPGWVLLVKIIQWAIENGLEEVDLMRGDEEYKYRFGARDRQVVGVEIRLSS